MLRPTIQVILSIVLIGSLTFTYAAGPSIGIAMASGPFEINRSTVQGNASLFEGSEVRTGDASSKLRINGGTRLEIGTESQVRVFGTHTVLEKGASQIENNAGYRLEARTLRVSGAAPKAIARVQLDGSNAVLVSALNGPVRVSNGSGVLLAKLAAGGSLRFQPQAGAADSFELSGCLLKKGGKVIIVDQTSNQIFELRGADSSTEFGNRVSVKGKGTEGSSPTVTGASQVVSVQSLSLIAPGGCLATSAAVGADPVQGATTSAPTEAQTPAGGTGGGANKAVIAGVVIAGGAGAGVAVALASKSKSK